MPSTIDPVAWLDAVLDTEPGRVFIETPDGKTYTYQDLADTSGRIASALTLRGVVAGDRVVAQVDKSPEALMLCVACWRLGAVFVPLNPAFTIPELEYFLGDAEPRVVIYRPQDKLTLAPIAQKKGVAHVETLGCAGEGTLTDLASARDSTDFPRFAGSPDEAIALLYTSGTTGRSKGAMITRRNLASNAAALVKAWRITKADVLLHALPIFHVHGLFIACNPLFAAGGRMLFLPKFEVNEIMRLMTRATVLMGVPTFYTRLLQHSDLDRKATAHMRLFISGSAPLLAETHSQFEAKTGHCILERYAMTETLVNTSNPYDGKRMAGTVGFAVPGVEIRVADPETGKHLSNPDSVGVLEVRGPNVFKGYWRNPEKTVAEFRADGFFVTGDLGKIDANNYVHLVGRAKDMIITGGFNVYPKEVEVEIDALAGVMESAVIGVPHPDFGEGVTAVVAKAKGATIDEKQVLTGLEQRLARYKHPKRVLFVDELPRNVMGKVQKNLLRKTYSTLYEQSNIVKES
ncbi:MAG TPA: malonyl-CoA synthase [Burkholderiales bacterium]|nr:malonyl-CoA synthase [Burkholderiales bacterium]